MSREMEDRLRAAYQAKADQVTDRRLAQLRAERDSQLATLLSEDVPIARLEHPPVQLDSRRQRHSRWFAPAVAAAAVAAVAAAAFALSTPGSHRNTPAPPASKASSPTASASPSVTGSPSATASSSTGTAPAYLPDGQTGARTDVPWGAVGTGWRLVEPTDSTGSAGSLYLYDPAGGRYLITDQVPDSAYLVAWSPDGQRALYQSSVGPNTRFQQLELASGKLSAAFTTNNAGYVSYTQPRGLAMLLQVLVQGNSQLVRYGTDGTPQLSYPAQIDGLGRLYGPALYTADGSQFVASAGARAVLMSNSGQLVLTYPLSRPSDLGCNPLRWWTADSFLEECSNNSSGTYLASLYLQPVAGDAPTLLIGQNSAGIGYKDAWALSNGDVLLAIASGCGDAGYDILHPDGSVVPLRLPDGVPAPGLIINMSGDLATFEVTKKAGCGDNVQGGLVDYNMVTGKTEALLPGHGQVINYPGD
jgi:hypothetical protein